MEHKGTVLIETDRLILRQFTAADSTAMFENWTSDDEVTKFLRWPTHKSIAVTQSLARQWVKKYSDKKTYQWAIVLKEYGEEPIGTISVVEQYENVGMVQIGYCIGKKWWHQGITTEAFSAIIPFLFDEVKANRIEARCDPLNLYSAKVMEDCGLTYEGTLRKADTNNTGIVDAAMYSILAK
ncbi:MAG: GNAT family N-acetyltransferase [Oscillospiraceae bacterium]